MNKRKPVRSLLALLLALCFAAVTAISTMAAGLSSNTGIIVTPLGTDVYLVDDMGVSSAYLIVGEDKALVIDSGIGNKNFYQVCQQYAQGKPVECALTHAHLDHVGAAKQFPQYYENGKDKNIEWQQNLLLRQIFGYASALPSITEHGIVLGNISDDNNDPNSVCVYIDDGWEYDLGGRTVRYYATPGHTGGSGCYYDDKSGFLFVGDMATPTPWLFFVESTDLGTYNASIKRIYSLSQDASTIYTGHQDQGQCTEERLLTLDELSAGINSLKGLKYIPAFLIVPSFSLENGEFTYTVILTTTAKISDVKV